MNSEDSSLRGTPPDDDDDARWHVLLGGPAAGHIDDDGFSRRVMAELPTNSLRRWRPTLVVAGATAIGALLAWIIGADPMAQAVRDALEGISLWMETDGPSVELSPLQMLSGCVAATSLLWAAYVVWQARGEC